MKNAWHQHRRGWGLGCPLASTFSAWDHQILKIAFKNPRLRYLGCISSIKDLVAFLISHDIIQCTQWTSPPSNLQRTIISHAPSILKWKSCFWTSPTLSSYPAHWTAIEQFLGGFHLNKSAVLVHAHMCRYLHISKCIKVPHAVILSFGSGLVHITEINNIA